MMAKETGYAWLMRHRDFDGPECLIWTRCRDPQNGYGRVGYRGGQYWTHRLMCELVHGPCPEGYEAAHSCGRGKYGCVHPKHLSWKTPSENQLDRRKHGTAGNASGSGPTALTPELVAEIRLLKGKKTQAEIGAMYGVHWTSIGNIFRGDTWAGEKMRRRRRA